MFKKLLNYCKENKKNSIVAAVLCILLLFFAGKAVVHSLTTPTVSYNNESNAQTVGGIWDSTEIKQTFVSKKSVVCGFGLRFGTYQRTPDGTVTVALVDSSTPEETVLFTETFDAKTLNDNGFENFYFEPISRCKGKTFSIIVTASGVGDKPVTIWCSESSVFSDGDLYINGVDFGKDLNIKIYQSGILGFNDYIMLALFAFLLFSIFFMAKKKMFLFADKISQSLINSVLIGFAYLLLLSAITCSVTDDVISYKPNWISVSALFAFILATLLLEKKLKLYASIKQFSSNEYARYRELVSTVRHGSKKTLPLCELLISAISLISTTAFGITLTLSLMLSRYSGALLSTLFVLAILSISTLLVKKSCFEKNTEVATLFLVVALIFGAFLSFALPPTSDYLWDAEIHYARTIDLKCILFNDTRTLYDDNIEWKSYYQFLDFFKDSEGSLKEMMQDYTLEGHQPNESINFYQYIGYLPLALGIAIGQLFSMNLLSTIALAKFTSILTCALVIYFGIKRLKSGKYLFACVALIPSCMLLGTSFSYDYWVTAFIIYAYACFVSELQKKDEKISSETIFLMLSAMILGCGPKMIYFALVFPMLFIGKHKFETKKDKNRYSLLCLGALLFVFVSFALPFFLNVGGSTDIRGGADVNSGEQFIFIFSNPFKYAGILIRFMCDYVALDDMTAQVINFSYMGTPNIIYGTIVVLLILFTAFVDKSEDLYPGRTRLALISFATCFAQIALVATALYISFTPVGHGTVNGCQYRYLFPVMIPFFYFLGSGKVKCNAKPAVLNTVIFSLITLTLFMSYYGVYLSRMN